VEGDVQSREQAMSWDEVPVGVTTREAIRHVQIRMIIPDAMPDESMFFVLSLLGGGFLGYLFGVT
ncbi:MAG TPA: hypothetical protein VGQ58_10215, partial [Candidatus Limnocylindrales bacterium]|nr:hypothetical protein [Candidatus Limnocylindrales bacterium]